MPSPDPAAVAIRGSWWRHVPLGGDPWHRPAVAASNRWQRGDVVAALYLADSAQTAWAEWYRHLAERAIPPMQTLPRELWRWHVDLERVADLRSPEALAARGLSPPRPTRADWPRFQRVGEALHGAGWPALVAASAARPSGFVLCLFRPGPAHPAGIEPVPPPERVDEPPAPPRGMTT
jgi:RES domain-containing protein